MTNLEVYIPNITVIFLTTLLITCIVVFTLYKLFNFITPFLSKPLLEKTIADTLPFYGIYKHKYIKLKNGSFASVVKLEGLDYSSISQNQELNLASLRQNLFNGLGLEGASLQFYISKSKAELNLQNKETKQGNVLKQIFNKVYQKANNSYQTNYYCFCTAKNTKDLKILNNKVLATFAMYYAEQLKQNDLLQFLYQSINHHSYTNLTYETNNIHYHLSSTNYDFNSKHITLTNNFINNLHCSIFTLNSFGSETSPALVNSILQMPCKLEIICNSNVFENTKALANLEVWKRMTFLNRPKAVEFFETSESIQANQESLIDTQLSFYFYAQSKEELKQIEKEFIKLYSSFGVNIIQEQKASEITYFNRFVGFNTSLRKRPITSSNLANLLNYKTNYNGLNKCDWGAYPLAYFNNIDGSLYKLFLHISEENEAVAHSVAFAPTGSGKTFLFEHIIAGALYHYPELKVYAFDKLSGMKVFTNALNGKYLSLKQEGVELNPLLLNLEDEENALFLAKWFEVVTQLEDNESLKLIDTAISLLKTLPSQDKKLSNLNLLFPKESAVYKALEPFAFGVHKDLFNAQSDSLNLEQSNFINFDMTNILDDEKLSSSVIFYIMHKIRKHSKTTAKPHLIFIDETSAMLKNKVFAKYIEVLLKEHRKLRGSINIVFQDVKDIETLGVKETVLNQCKTRFIFKNIEANKDIYQEALELNEQQIDIVKGITQTSERMLMVQKGNKVSVLNTELSYLGNLTKFYASSIKQVKHMEDLQRQYGDNWQDEYLKDEN